MSTHESLDIPGWDAVVTAGRVAPPKDTVVAAAQSAVGAMIREANREAAGAGAGLGPTRRVRGLLERRSLRWSLAGVSAAAAATCGIAVLATGSPAAPGNGSANTAAAQSAGGVGSRQAAFFSGLAQIESAQGRTSPRAWKLDIETTQAGAAARHYTEVLDRSGIVVTDGGQSFAKDRIVTWAVGSGSVDWNGLDKLPTDPAALRARLSTAAPGVEFGQIADLLGESPASPALRSALYQVLGGLPGVRVAGRQADAGGRVGSAVEFSAGGTTALLIIDAETGTLWEKTQIATKATPADPSCGTAGSRTGHCAPALHVGDVISRETYLQSGPAGSGS